MLLEDICLALHPYSGSVKAAQSLKKTAGTSGGAPFTKRTVARMRSGRPVVDYFPESGRLRICSCGSCVFGRGSRSGAGSGKQLLNLEIRVERAQLMVLANDSSPMAGSQPAAAPAVTPGKAASKTPGKAAPAEPVAAKAAPPAKAEKAPTKPAASPEPAHEAAHESDADEKKQAAPAKPETAKNKGKAQGKAQDKVQDKKRADQKPAR